MATVSELTKTDLKDRWERARTTIRNMRAEGEQITRRAISQVMMVTGGAAVGVARGMWGNEEGKLLIPGTEIEADLATGVLLGAGSMVGMMGDASDYMSAFSGGMLAGYADRECYRLVKEYQSSEK